ncbi:helix-turn-helix domain-containing protein [Arthrobacter sp. NPDC090010]|uniref:helix-turn-helix domain-containing protein n=1 Tax=Arthrobacter sp. NPDC090010 TaxID=3363942 RepID=UPI00380F358B
MALIRHLFRVAARPGKKRDAMRSETSPSAIALARFEMFRGQAFERHVHEEQHQLAWASTGVLMVDVDDRCWVLPPNLALWIPAGTWHVTLALRESVLEGVYLDPGSFRLSWDEPVVLSVSALARDLIQYLAGELDPSARSRAEAVLADVLTPVRLSSIELSLPQDPRAREVADLLLADPGEHRSLEQLAVVVRSSPRTLLRVFLAETGMTFTQWRTHVRLQAAIAHLAEGHSVSRVAGLVGYATASAFVSAFRRVTGHTPAAYFSRMEAGV